MNKTLRCLSMLAAVFVATGASAQERPATSSCVFSADGARTPVNLSSGAPITVGRLTECDLVGVPRGNVYKIMNNGRDSAAHVLGAAQTRIDATTIAKPGDKITLSFAPLNFAVPADGSQVTIIKLRIWVQ